MNNALPCQVSLRPKDGLSKTASGALIEDAKIGLCGLLTSKRWTLPDPAAFQTAILPDFSSNTGPKEPDATAAGLVTVPDGEKTSCEVSICPHTETGTSIAANGMIGARVQSRRFTGGGAWWVLTLI